MSRKTDFCAALRRESRTGQTAANYRERDNTKAVISYMIGRGAFADHDCSRLGGEREGDMNISLVVDGLPWNPLAPKRVVALQLRQVVRRASWGRRRPMLLTTEIIETARIPNWDYDGIDPLIAREPWERQQADKLLDQQAQRRRSESDCTLSISDEAHNLECKEFLAQESGRMVVA